MSKKQQNNGGFAKRKAVEAEEKRKKQRLRRIYTILGIVGLVVIAAATFAIVRSNLADEPAEATGTVIESDRALAALRSADTQRLF